VWPTGRDDYGIARQELGSSKCRRPDAFALEPDAGVAKDAVAPRFGLVRVQTEVECGAILVVLDQKPVRHKKCLQLVSIQKFKCVLLSD